MEENKQLVEKTISSLAIPVGWPIEKHEVANLLATKGMTIDRVSEVTEVPVSTIKRWKKQPDFAKYMRDIILDEAENMRAYRLMLCLKMIDARVSKIEEVGDYSLLSTKDTLDIMAEMRKDTEKSEEKEQTQYIKTIEALLVKSAAKSTITYDVEGGLISETSK